MASNELDLGSVPGGLPARVLAELPQPVAKGAAEEAGDLGAQVGDETGPGPADLFDGEHDANRGVVVVVAHGHGPGHLLELVVVAGRYLVGSHRVVVDRAPHRAAAFGGER